MRKPTKTPATAARRLNDDEIRDYAYHLYTQGGCQPGHDLDHWLEAEACLCACIPKEHSRSRLHRHIRKDVAAFTVPSPEAQNLSS